MTSLSHGTSDWFSPVSVANELAAQHSNTWQCLLSVANLAILLLNLATFQTTLATIFSKST